MALVMVHIFKSQRRAAQRAAGVAYRSGRSPDWLKSNNPLHRWWSAKPRRTGASGGDRKKQRLQHHEHEVTALCSCSNWAS